MSKEDPQTDAEMEEAYGPVPESTGPRLGVSGGPESALYFMSPVQAILQKLRDFMGVTAKADRLPDPTPEQILARLPPDAVEDFLRNRDAMWSGQFANQMPQNLQRTTTKADSAFNMPEVSDDWGDRARYPMRSWEPEWHHPIKSDSQIASERFPFYYDATGKFPTKGTKPIQNTITPQTTNLPLANAEMKLSPQEQNLYMMHLKNLYDPMGGIDLPNNSRATLNQIGVGLGGKEYNLPTVYGGKFVDQNEAVMRAIAQGLNKFPSYKTPEQAEQRYQQMHEYMNKDTQSLKSKDLPPIDKAEEAVSKEIDNEGEE